MAYIKKIKLGNNIYEIYDENAVHNGSSDTVDIIVKKAESADTAIKLGTDTIGSVSKPVYLNNGVATEIGYNIQSGPLTYSESEIPTSFAVSTAISNKTTVKLVSWTSSDMT